MMKGMLDHTGKGLGARFASEIEVQLNKLAARPVHGNISPNGPITWRRATPLTWPQVVPLWERTRLPASLNPENIVQQSTSHLSSLNERSFHVLDRWSTQTFALIAPLALSRPA